MKCGVVVFPGSNCDHDMLHVLGNVMGCEVSTIWHKDESMSDWNPSTDILFLPGGFSFGDHLRTGAIASHSPVMKSVVAFANQGGHVVGICNGFQILCESGLLPGVLLQNKKQLFVSKNAHLKVVNAGSFVSNEYQDNQVISIPVAHADGRYFCSDEDLQKLKDNNQIIFQYCDENGDLTEESNFNGSVHHIAGITNEQGNVFGMMPHPERASEEILGNTQGLAFFKSILKLAMLVS